MTRLSKIGLSLAASGLLFGSATTPAFAEDQAAQNQNQDAQQPAPKHHSKAKGAVVGGAGGAVVGGKKGAAVGAAGGALVQHHKNKKEAKQQEKAQEQK
jgi:hypothetical protein